MANEYWTFKKGNKWYWKAMGFQGTNSDGSYGPFSTKKEALDSYKYATSYGYRNPSKRRKSTKAKSGIGLFGVAVIVGLGYLIVRNR